MYGFAEWLTGVPYGDPSSEMLSVQLLLFLFLRWDLWAFGVLRVRVIHNTPKDVLTGTERAASPWQFPPAQDVLEGIPGVRRRALKAEWKLQGCCSCTTWTKPEAPLLLLCPNTHWTRTHCISVSVPCRTPLKLPRLALLSVWEMQHK